MRTKTALTTKRILLSGPVLLGGAIVALSGLACAEDFLNQLLGTSPPGADLAPAVAVAEPNTDTTVAPGAAAIIRWADIATDAGTAIAVRAQRRDPGTDEAIGSELTLLDGRDAMEDGDGDILEWDITGVRVGEYEIRVIISAPDGTTAEDTSNGKFMVTTALPVPTLTFTNPGATDVTFNPGDMLGITWTDNGSSNSAAKLTLGLDLDFDHDGGDEIILLCDQDLSTDADTGSFSFTGVDVDGNAVAANTYVVFATIDDGANDPVDVDATGQLVVNP